jgi:hypothetical protein
MNQKMGDLTNIETEQIIGAHLAGASVIKTDTLGVSRGTVSNVTLACSNHGKTTTAKNSGQKLTMKEKDCCT